MLALIAGRGALPGAVVSAAEGPVVVAALADSPPDSLTPDLSFRLETLGTLIADLKARGVTALCLCGGIDRPVIDPSRIDAATAPLVPRLTDALALGDDGALRIVLALFEESGFAILPAHEAAPELLLPEGVPTTRHPDDSHAEAALLGDAVLTEMAAADLGQACVIAGGKVVAREEEAGTDALLAGLPEAARGGLLYKAPKPGQDRRADLPTVGPETLRGAARAGLSGLILEAGGVLVLDQPRSMAEAEAAGLFLWSRRRPD
ncbi:UDP-2,3-diacylglucosamine diphosphatase LpxI [Roseivivax sp. GX 12232]|uniref:LpxI family protein n=1 Tax=Roseivivax sp. GX 12232 TaxID=2900547 RepID=UPI001E523C80|nr:UDP-2,3-diacylglucosamine diphosphatase LpxI [Roseivivax sp. GX 12232]